MIKTLTFWCPYLGDVGTVKAVIESAKSLNQSKNTNVKFLIHMENLIIINIC